MLKTRSGVLFETASKRWAYRDGVTSVSMDFGRFEGFSSSLVLNLKCVLAWYVQNRAAGTVRACYSALRYFHKIIRPNSAQLEQITEIELLNYRSSLSVSERYKFGQLRGFLLRWQILGYSGISDSAIKLLRQIRTPGMIKGVAVLTWDPVSGPLTDLEFESVQCALNHEYGAGNISLEYYLLGWLTAALGVRPIQLAAMKIRDVCIVADSLGNTGFWVNVPRAKQRQRTSRDSFTRRPLVREIGEALLSHVSDLKSEFSEVIFDPSQIPLFPSRQGHEWSEGFEYHRTGGGISIQIRKIFASLSVRSERLSQDIPVFATRLRRTLGTRAAAEGHSPYVIAQMLDHEDTQHVGVYAAATPAIIERIDRAVALHMAPIAQAFAGVLIRDESEATRGGDVSSRILDLRIDRSGKPMGSCGQHSFCGFAAPIACYTCKAFEPWADGPHEAVLQFLLDKRDQLMKTTDSRMASINDRSILAVAEVIRRVEQLRSSLGHE
nr:site-specific integrase [Pseudomonas aeruginosa]